MPKRSQSEFERYFLKRHAAVWLSCRFRVMGHQLIGSVHKPDLAFDLLGMVDFSHEMRLICRERLTAYTKTV